MIIQQIKHRLAAEHINTHRGQIGPLECLLGGEAQGLGIDSHLGQVFTLWLFPEFLDASISAGAHQPESFCLGGIHWQGAHGQLGAGIYVVLDEAAVVHPVELIPREDQVVVHVPFMEEGLVLPDGIGGAFKPAGAIRGLLGRQHFYKPLAKPGRKVVAHRQVTVERGAVELG